LVGTTDFEDEYDQIVKKEYAYTVMLINKSQETAGSKSIIYGGATVLAATSFTAMAVLSLF
jgi:hypothetical protein